MLQPLIKSLIIAQFLFFSFQSHAKDLVSSFDLLQGDAFDRYSGGNEFMSGKEPGVVMMKVNLWGAVRKPGIHHIPIKTDLISLLSYGGGPNETADIDDVTIKRNLGKTQKIIQIDLEDVIHGNKAYDLTLQPDDIIVIPAKQPLINQDTYMLATLITTLATAALTIAILGKQ